MLCLWNWGRPAGWQKVPDSVRRCLWSRSAVRSWGASGLWSEANRIFLPTQSTIHPPGTCLSSSEEPPLCVPAHSFPFPQLFLLRLQPHSCISLELSFWADVLSALMRSWGSHSAVTGKLGWWPRSEGCLLCCSGFTFLIWKWMGKDNSKGFLLFCNFFIYS